jgi:hypothetical protein
VNPLSNAELAELVGATTDENAAAMFAVLCDVLALSVDWRAVGFTMSPHPHSWDARQQQLGLRLWLCKPMPN